MGTPAQFASLFASAGGGKDFNDAVQALGGLIGTSSGGATAGSSSGTASGTTNVRNSRTVEDLSFDQVTSIEQLIAALSGRAQGMGRDAAIADSQGFAQKAQQDFLQTILPGIVGQQAGAGIYNGTATAGLATQAAAQLAAEVGAKRAATVAEYNNTGIDALVAALQGYGVIRGARGTVTENQNSTQNQNQTQNQNSTTSTDNNGGLLGQTSRFIRGLF